MRQTPSEILNKINKNDILVWKKIAYLLAEKLERIYDEYDNDINYCLLEIGGVEKNEYIKNNN